MPKNSFKAFLGFFIIYSNISPPLEIKSLSSPFRREINIYVSYSNVLSPAMNSFSSVTGLNIYLSSALSSKISIVFSAKIVETSFKGSSFWILFIIGLIALSQSTALGINKI